MLRILILLLGITLSALPAFALTETPKDTMKQEVANSSELPTYKRYIQTVPETKGVVSWKVLAQVVVEPKRVGKKTKITIQFSENITALDGTEVQLQGFMFPLDMGAKQKRFLLSALPPSCGFCLPAGSEGLVEVLAKTPIKYSFEPITITGKFQLLKDDSMGLYYRLNDATPIQ